MLRSFGSTRPIQFMGLLTALCPSSHIDQTRCLHPSLLLPKFYHAPFGPPFAIPLLLTNFGGANCTILALPLGCFFPGVCHHNHQAPPIHAILCFCCEVDPRLLLPRFPCPPFSLPFTDRSKVFMNELYIAELESVQLINPSLVTALVLAFSPLR